MWSLLFIYVVLTGFASQKPYEHLVVALEMKFVVTVQEDAAEISRTYWPVMAVISLFMNACDKVPLILPKKQEPKSLTLCGCSFSRWGRELLAFSIP
jgi:hypothetical protein